MKLFNLGILVLCLIFSLSLYGQQSKRANGDENQWTSRIVVGGGIGAGYNNGWNINVSPEIAYKVTDRFWPGIGLDYNYVSYRYDSENKDKFSVFGPKAFAVYYITPQLNAGTEYVFYNYTRNQIFNGIPQKTKESQQSWLIGAGYTQRFGQDSRAGIRAELYYDVFYQEGSSVFNFRVSPWVPRLRFLYGL